MSRFDIQAKFQDGKDPQFWPGSIASAEVNEISSKNVDYCRNGALIVLNYPHGLNTNQ